MLTCRYLELNLAPMILSDTGSHPSRLCTVPCGFHLYPFLSRAQVLHWPSSSSHRSSISFHSAPGCWHNKPLHLLSHLAHLPISSIILAFHCPIVTHDLSDSNFIDGLSVILCLARWSNRLLKSCTSASPQYGAVETLVSVSVISRFYGGGLLAHRPAPNLEGQEITLRLVSKLWPVWHRWPCQK